MPETPFALYNPALLPPEILLSEYTARRPLLETLLGIIRGNAPSQPQQHCLLIGARGMGKTTTLWAIAHRVNKDAELFNHWQPVVFDEESRRVGDLADFWLEAIRQWEYAVQDHSDRAGKLLIKAGPDIEDQAHQTFMELIQHNKKRALLLIDNLNDMLGSIYDLEQLHRLRAILMDESRIMVIGTATRSFDEVTSIDRPFYDFFRCFDLRPLSLEEMRECLSSLAKTRNDEVVEHILQERAGSIQALHLLTGGNPRLIKTFYRLLRDGLRGDIRADLERLLDEFTPYFKAIIDALPPQQQRIFDAVALAWDPVEVSTIVTATRLPSNQVSAQLRALKKMELISENPSHPKRKTYLLSDRFSNIHYLMRHGRAARNRLDWFVALVRIVFPDQEARNLCKAIELDPNGAYPWSNLAELLNNKSGATVEARNCAVTGLLLKPEDHFTRIVFQQVCGNSVDDLKRILPSLVAWCIAHPKDSRVFDFSVEGLIQLARIAKPKEALTLLDEQPDAFPFETLCDAFRAHADRQHLNRLAPERRSIVIELLKRISSDKSKSGK